MAFFRLSFVLALFALASCSSPYMGKELFGADEFVMDSYRIREGKFSILEMEGACPDPFDESLLDEYQDTVNEGDILLIALYHPKREDIVDAVKEIGETIGFPVVNGKVLLPDLPGIEVAGLTLDEARLKIQSEYNRQIRDTEVFLAYGERTERKVELAGLVELTSIPVDGKIRLFDVLSQAKVPVEANLFKSYIAREGKLLSVDLNQLLKEGDMSQNIVMRGGDKIYIADSSASSLMVMGEVGRERVVHLPTGSISLRHALAKK